MKCYSNTFFDIYQISQTKQTLSQQGKTIRLSLGSRHMSTQGFVTKEILNQKIINQISSC